METVSLDERLADAFAVAGATVVAAVGVGRTPRSGAGVSLQPVPERRAAVGDDGVGADAGNAVLAGRSRLARGKEDVDAAVGPVHVAGTAFELPRPADPVGEVGE